MTTEQDLSALNIQIAEMEKRRDKDAEDFFDEILSNELIFRRASGAVEGKSGFLDNLKKPYPFRDLKAEDIETGRVDGLDRALVTLMIVGRRADGTEGRYRNIRLFSRSSDAKYNWRLEFWYNYELTSS